MPYADRAPDDRMNLGVFLGGNCGYHVAGWRHAGAFRDMASNPDRWFEVAERMEQAKLDMLFIADVPGVAGSDNPGLLAKTGRVDSFEPLAMLGALAARTTRLGLVATVATAYTQPFNVARAIASLDQLSRGRIGWNLVTGGSSEDARNFNLDSHIAHHQRYEQAEEFADVVTGLWDSIDEGALVHDAGAGCYIRPDGIHQLNHEGRFYKVRGPLGVARSPQGRPILIQAGKSDEGMNLAARIADVVFTSQATIGEAQAYYSGIKSRAEGVGRDPASVRVMPGISIYLGRDEAEATRKMDELVAMTPIEAALQQLKVLLGGVDLSQFDLDEPWEGIEGNSARMSAGPAYTRLAQGGALTLRELALRCAVAKDHLIVAGTATHVADVMEQWFREGAADGFNILPAVMPTTLYEVIDEVVPELQRRGLFRTEYDGPTLRDHLGLPVPVSRYA